MQPDSNTNTTATQQKTPFWRNKERRYVFLAGIGLVIFATVCTLVISGWKEAPVVEVKQESYSCKNSSERPYTLIYEVGGKRYGITACTTTPLRTVTYYPGNPNIALINAVVVYKVIATVLGILGGVLIIGALFATNTKQPENSAGLDSQNPPTPIPESIVPTGDSTQIPSTKKQLMRKISIFSIAVIIGVNGLFNIFPSNTIVTTIGLVISGIAFCVLLFATINLNNILRRERKDASKTGESLPLTIEEISIRIILGVAIGLAIIIGSIFALSFFFGNSK